MKKEKKILEVSSNVILKYNLIRNFYILSFKEDFFNKEVSYFYSI